MLVTKTKDPNRVKLLEHSNDKTRFQNNYFPEVAAIDQGNPEQIYDHLDRVWNYGEFQFTKGKTAGVFDLFSRCPGLLPVMDQLAEMQEKWNKEGTPAQLDKLAVFAVTNDHSQIRDGFRSKEVAEIKAMDRVGRLTIAAAYILARLTQELEKEERGGKTF